MKAAQVLLLDTPNKLVVDERRDDDTTSDNPTNKRQQLDEDISSNAAATSQVIKWSDNSTVIIAILTSCWYYSSSITAISTQLILNKQKQDDGKQEVILAALVLTSLQLLIGSAVGKLTLHFVSYNYDHSPSSLIKGGDHQSQKQYPLGLLHGLGCICTNVGFGFGSASLVQIVKLLEPIETLILCVVIQYMTYSGINSFTDTISQIVPFRKAIATLIIISGTFMLLSQKSLESNTYSLLFALGSGMCMSLRNVIKKNIEKRSDKNHTVVPTIPNGIQDFLSITISATVPTVLITIVVLVYNNQFASSILYKIINNNSGVLIKAVFCHCIYNMASISVLGFTSAPAHSLLNVGKRIINVLAATMFFHIPLSFVGKIGMLVAATGALLYNDIWLLVVINKIDNNRVQHRRYFTRLLVWIIVVTTFSTNSISNIFGATNNTDKNTNSTMITGTDMNGKRTCKVMFKDKSMALCHFLAYGKNFGDEIGIAIATKLLENHFQCNSEQVPVINLAAPHDRTGKICLFNLGSIHHMLNPNDHVWGTGINPKWQSRTTPSNITYHAVRGVLTREKVQSTLKEGETLLPIGDPGSATIKLYQPQYKWVSDGSPCFVPHHQDQELFLKNQDMYDELRHIRMISVRNTWKNVTKALSTCSTVASSSLHGLVIADALGIPNRWFQFSGGKTEKTEGYFKYQDYFSTIQRHDATPMRELEDVFNISKYWSRVDSSIMTSLIDGIEASFPYDLFETEDSVPETSADYQS